MSANETLWRGNLVLDQAKEEYERYLSGYKVTMQDMQQNKNEGVSGKQKQILGYSGYDNFFQKILCDKGNNIFP